MNNTIHIQQGRLIDPANAIDQIQDLFIADSKVVALGDAPEDWHADRTIDATGMIVCPGLIDLCANLREPGLEHKATIQSETRAAAAAGITTLCCPPDTNPVIDTPAVLELIKQRAEDAAAARVIGIGALTRKLQGKELSEMGALQKAGCPALSNQRGSADNLQVTRLAMEYASSFGITLFLHAEDPCLADHGCAHEGRIATRLGLPAIPAAAETAAVAQYLALIEETGVRAHFCRISTRRGAQMIARAHYEGVRVSADVAMHQLFLSEMDIADFNPHCHVRPPLRTQRDRDSLRAAVADGVIMAICSDHQPHEDDAKLAPFPATEPGISAIDSLLGLGMRLVEENILSINTLIERLTSGPASILGLDSGKLQVGQRADICIFDPQQDWILNQQSMRSQGKNTPFMGWEFRGQVYYTLVDGIIVHQKPRGQSS
ncbi:MAG: dihydroorotase [Gammaproteobacteria bacterium]|nr:dihydroorotase [Gammaproteobacteria bacterium]